MTPKRPRDVNQLAKRLVEEATGEAELQREAPSKDPEKRGKARAKRLSPQRRRDRPKGS